jgi:hypothetical protein
VASSAVLATRRSAYVWVAEPAGDGSSSYTVRRADVQTGESDGRFTVVRGGLRPGQKVVAYGHDYLRTGDTVMAVPWSDEGPAALPDPVERPAAGGHAGHGGSSGNESATSAAHPAAGATAPKRGGSPAPDHGAHAGHGGH